MRYWLGCTISSIRTNLFCELEIGHNRTRQAEPGSAQTWQRIGGQLDIRDTAGDWMYTDRGGICLVSTAFESDPYWHDPANWLVKLFNVPERFAERLGCGEYFSGDGKMFLTNEDVRWKMWYPCG